MKILVENSTWNNIGDGFYQSALFMLLKSVFPNADIYMEEGPAFRAHRPRTEFQRKNIFHMMNYQDADLHVFSGPMIRQVMSNYSNKIKRIVNKGNNYAFISVSGAGSSQNEIETIGEFLNEHPPVFFASRDNETYEKYKKYVPFAYDGICTAFAVKKYLPVDTINYESPFFISSFYRELEPIFYPNNLDGIDSIEIKRKATFLNLNFRLSRHLNFLRKQQKKVGEYDIVRVRQDLSTHFKHIKFSHPNSFMSFNPLSVLSLYKSADFTISDRVHSCAVSLTFGKPARLLYDTPRAGIFTRLGWDHKSNNGIMYPKDDVIEEEISKLITQIKKYITL